MDKQTEKQKCYGPTGVQFRLLTFHELVNTENENSLPWEILMIILERDFNPCWQEL